MTDDKILDKLSKLKAMAAGEAALGNAEAAEAFAGMINRLLLKHELEATDIPMGGVVKDEPIVEHRVYPAQHEYKAVSNRVGWQEALASIVARAHMCRFLVTPGSNAITVVGTREHVMFAEYAYVVLVRAADRMSIVARDVYWREHRHEPDFQSGNYRAAWLSGFISRIGERFAEARRHEVQEAANAGTALMRLDQALARASKHVDDRYKGRAASTKIGSGISAGYGAGRKAADNMAIGQKGVGQGAGTHRLKG